MSEQETPDVVQTIINQSLAKANPGKAILDELDPQLPWAKATELVGQELVFVDFEARKGLDEGDAYACRVVTKDHTLVRVTFGGHAVMHKLDVVAKQLPLTFKLMKRKSKQTGMSYFDLE